MSQNKIQFQEIFQEVFREIFFSCESGPRCVTLYQSRSTHLPAVLDGGRDADRLVVDGDEERLAEAVALRVGGGAHVLARHRLGHVLQDELLLVDVHAALALLQLLTVDVPAGTID